HLIIGKRNDRDRCLRSLVDGAALDRARNDVASLPLALLLGLLLDVPDQFGRFVTGLFLDRLQEDAPRLLGGPARDSLQLIPLLRGERRDLFVLLFELSLLVLQAALLLI